MVKILLLGILDSLILLLSIFVAYSVGSTVTLPKAPLPSTILEDLILTPLDAASIK